MLEKHPKIKILEIRQVGYDLFHEDGRTNERAETDRQTDVTKLRVAFRNFANPSDTYQYNIV
jgi:hypothetical protein